MDYFNDFESARRFAEILCAPHHHHHEKKLKKNLSNNNLNKVISSSNFNDFATKKGKIKKKKCFIYQILKHIF